MRIFILILFVLPTIFSCDNEETNQNESTGNRTINSTSNNDSADNNKILNSVKFNCEGPRGGAFIGTNADEISYRIFRIQIINDTTISLDLNIDFPKVSTFLQPDSTVELELSILPNHITPNSIKDTIDFGVKNVSSFFESNIMDFNSFETSIAPLDTSLVYVGVRFKSNIEKGLTRSAMFLNGQKIDASFLPVKSIQKITQKNSSLNLVYGIAVDPPNFYKLIPCGNIYINKN